MSLTWFLIKVSNVTSNAYAIIMNISFYHATIVVKLRDIPPLFTQIANIPSSFKIVVKIVDVTMAAP